MGIAAILLALGIAAEQRLLHASDSKSQQSRRYELRLAFEWEVALHSTSSYEELRSVLVRYRRIKRSKDRRPVFVFCCGGDERSHPARRELANYVYASKNDRLKNVFCVKAENVAADSEFDELDLLTQEAMIADASDVLILFAESVGSFCELGAFASLPHVRSILAVVEDKKYAGNKSFLNDGPVRMIEMAGSPLNEVFYADLTCPMKSSELCSYVTNIRALVGESENHRLNEKRKLLNARQDDVNVGSLVHELLDLIHLFGPISEKDLIALYCDVKSFDAKKVVIRSHTIASDMKLESTLSFKHVLALMRAIEIVRILEDAGEMLYYTTCNLESYFMFKNTEFPAFRSAIAKTALGKRNRGWDGYSNVYRRFD